MNKFLSLIIMTLVVFWITNNWFNNTVFAESNEQIEDTSNHILDFITRIELDKSIEYIVREWDNLDKISEKFWVDKKWIIYSNVWNIIDNLNYDENDSIELHEWEIILIPHKEWIAYKVLKWDDMYKIINDFWISEEKYLEINWTLEINENDIVLIPSPRFMNEEIVYWPKSKRFPWWQCTFHVNQKVSWITWWGNAKHWITNAKAHWHLTWSKPIKWAIVQFSWRWMPLWHVWYVEEVYENWDFLISEMNFSKLWKITYRTIKSNNKTINWFIYLNEAKKEYLSSNFSNLLAKSNKN